MNYTKEDLMREVNVTDKYVAFWGSAFSNFYPCKIKVDTDWDDKPIDEITFTSSEQYFMWQKAMWFHDQETADEILDAKTPKEAKALGRKVKGFDDKEWADTREYAMWNAVLLKFRQNPDIKEFLLDPDFADKHFVEGSPVDGIWGVKVDWRDTRIADENNWDGLNLLGKTLDKVRRLLKTEEFGTVVDEA
jgi:ribA/ribD-fused uncharacterized protein